MSALYLLFKKNSSAALFPPFSPFFRKAGPSEKFKAGPSESFFLPCRTKRERKKPEESGTESRKASPPPGWRPWIQKIAS
jgi:hypothetical protein